MQGLGWMVRSPRRVGVIAMAVIAAAVAAAAWTASAGARGTRSAATTPAAAASGALKQVSGTLPGIGLATLLNPAPATQQIQIGVGISRPDPAGEQALYDAIYDKSSPQYHHFLSVSQFNARFGVAPTTTAAVRSFLTSGGLSIASSSAGGDYFTATGTIAQIDQLLHVSIGDYTYKGTTFMANNTAPSVPAGLPIDGIAGLENLTHFTPAAVKGRQLARTTNANAAIAKSRELLTRAHAVKTAASGSGGLSGTLGGVASGTLGGITSGGLSGGLSTNLGSPVTVSNEGTEQTYTPQDLWGFYNAPGASALTNANGLSTPSTVANSTATLGQGQIMGVFTEGEDSSVVRNLRLFEETVGLPKVPVRIVETEGTPDDAYSDNSGAVEWYLDSQSSTAMAPDVKQLDLFTAKTFQDSDVAKEFDYWANDGTGPREMNASFGECEENPTEPVTGTGPLSTLPFGVGLGGAMENISDPSLRQAAMEGRTLFASAGDTGSGCPSLVLPVLGGANGLAIQPVPFQEYPCISDYVVCVGGTTPSSKGAGYPAAAQRSNEQAWTYTGGGSSYFNPAPSFQAAVKNVNINCVSNDLGTTVYAPGTAPQCRGVPDVADMSGGGNDWFFFYTDGEPSIEGGTSLASPLMMGQWARVQAAAPTQTQSSGGLGFANATIYAQAANADACTTAPCGGTYGRDFYDITQAEDAGDVPGGQTGVAAPVGAGVSNGVYGPTAGWDYTTGWGSLNDTNFIQDVDGTTSATMAYTGQEAAPVNLCTATMSSPSGNATDLVSFANDAGLDLTGATLSSQGSNITATLTVPSLSTGLPPTSALGADFYVGWSYNGTFYYVKASESPAKSFTYATGSTGAPFAKGLPVSGTYSDSKTATPTGSVNTSTGTITITVPASAVGSPPAGALLESPQAFVQEEIAILDETIDSADTLRGASTDDGQLDSIGADVVMGGTNCSNTLPATSVSSAQTGVLGSGSGAASGAGSNGSGSASASGPGATSGPGSAAGSTLAGVKRPTLTVKHRSLIRRRFRLSGVAKFKAPATKITSVGIAVAKVVKHKHATECEFLSAKHRWGKPRACTPAPRYFKAKGTAHWSYVVKFHFTKFRRYRVYERATENTGVVRTKYQSVLLR